MNLPPLPEPDGTAEANKVPHTDGGYEFDEIPAWSEALVRAYAAEAVRVALEEAASIKTLPQVAIFPAGMEFAAKAYQKGMDDYAVAVRALIPKD